MEKGSTLSQMLDFLAEHSDAYKKAADQKVKTEDL